MYANDWLQLGFLLLVVLFLTRPLGLYICRVFDPHKKTFLDPVLKPVENLLYRWGRIDRGHEQDWKQYLKSIVCFSAVSCLGTALILGLQAWLPLNPEHREAPSWDLLLNTAISFMTNSDWQSYSGEQAMSYFSQMGALAVQNFLSAAVGLCVATALVRGIARKGGTTIGYFWVDLVRVTLYLLLPLAFIASSCLLSEGVPQNFNPYVTAKTLEGSQQILAQGPMASQEAIKLIGSNGGGFTNANSAHPYENPTPLSNFLQMLLVFLIPSAQIFAFGKWISDQKHAWCMIAALFVVFVAGVALAGHGEIHGNPEWADLGLTGGNWEGKEVRFGLFGSALYGCLCTATSCGAVNAAVDSFTPFGGLVLLLNMQLGSAIFGGVGVGLYSVLLFVLLALFISGLIIGRTPEYLGKKIEAYDVKMTMLAILPYVVIVHLFTALACLSVWGVGELNNQGPHGFSEMLYAFSSAAANNGSAFAGLNSNTLGYNLTLAISMLLGRFLIIAPVLALAGSFVQKQLHPKTFPISSLLFISLLIGIIFLLGALTFLPALTMGPVLEHFAMFRRELF